jgi:redox-sensing transcriptional repressor
MPIDRNQLSEKVVARLTLYRRLLIEQFDPSRKQIYSHELARLACVSSAQVRRDIMAIEYFGMPNRGYEVRELIDDLSRTLDNPDSDRVAMIGIGNLGRAIIAFFNNRRPNLKITAAFDIDPEKIDRVMYGCRCYPMEKLGDVVRAEQITTGVLTVTPSVAQTVADSMVEAGISGILNYTTVPLRVPPNVYLLDRDMTMALETVAFFSRRCLSPVPQLASRG